MCCTGAVIVGVGGEVLVVKYTFCLIFHLTVHFLNFMLPFFLPYFPEPLLYFQNISGGGRGDSGSVCARIEVSIYVYVYVYIYI